MSVKPNRKAWLSLPGLVVAAHGRFRLCPGRVGSDSAPNSPFPNAGPLGPRRRRCHRRRTRSSPGRRRSSSRTCGKTWVRRSSSRMLPQLHLPRRPRNPKKVVPASLSHHRPGFLVALFDDLEDVSVRDRGRKTAGTASRAGGR